MKEVKKPIPPEIVPHSPGNIKLSKAQFIAQENKRREDNLKIKEFAATLKIPKAEIPKVEAPKVEEKKKTGRPKKIE